MLSRFLVAGVAVAMLTAGCAAQGGDHAQSAPPPTGPDACGASKVSGYVGMQRSDDLIAKIKSASGAQILRILGPHDAMTMDFREERLTITTDADGRIKTLRCV